MVVLVAIQSEKELRGLKSHVTMHGGDSDLLLIVTGCSVSFGIASQFCTKTKRSQIFQSDYDVGTKLIWFQKVRE